MTAEILFFAIIYFVFGTVIGSFLNVCIYRIPRGESIVTDSSHCVSCGNRLRWYDLFPVFSYIFLGGKCRYCKSGISPQYPIIEAVNGIFYVLIYLKDGFGYMSILECMLVSALIVLSVIDFRTFEIPIGINIFILALGLVRVVFDRSNWLCYVIGFFAVSAFLGLILILSKGKAIGGGDVKLMAVCGLFLGWKMIVLAFFVGCILGSVIHLLRMKLSGEKNVLALGPYLSAGVVVVMFFGQNIIDLYMKIMILN